MKIIDLLADCYISYIENYNIPHELRRVGGLHEEREKSDLSGLRAERDDDN